MTELEKIQQIRNEIIEFTRTQPKDMFDQGFKYGMMYAVSIINQYYPFEMLIPFDKFNYVPEPPTLNE